MKIRSETSRRDDHARLLAESSSHCRCCTRSRGDADEGLAVAPRSSDGSGGTCRSRPLFRETTFAIFCRVCHSCSLFTVVTVVSPAHRASMIPSGSPRFRAIVIRSVSGAFIRLASTPSLSPDLRI